jgi:isocitrate lyase
MFTRKCMATSSLYTISRATRRLATTSSTVSAFPTLPLDPPTVDQEAEEFETRVAALQEHFSSPRYKGIKRPYTAVDVVSKQGSMPVTPLPGSLLADKLFALLKRAADAGKPVHTMGAIDPVQLTQMARYQEVVYVSGWASSSVLTTANNEVGPDLAWVLYIPRIYTVVS